MKIGILFSGQGSQYPGMGRNLYDNYPKAKEVFDKAGDEIKSWCFEGSKEMLRQTHITQPSVYTVTLAAYEAFMENNIEVMGVAGFSMGEYAALTAAEVIEDFDTALGIIRKRGQFMTEAGTDENGEAKGAMAAVFGKRDKILSCVDTLREGDILEAVNFNSPMQTVVAGDISAIDRLKERGKSEFGLKVIPLSVSTAFHSPMMAPAAERLRQELASVKFHKPRIRVYTNVTGDDLMKGFDGDIDSWMIDKLAAQAKLPVYWQETIENMHRDGAEAFIEVGPGSTLSGFVAKIIKGARVFHIEDKESLERALAEVEK